MVTYDIVPIKNASSRSVGLDVGTAMAPIPSDSTFEIRPSAFHQAVTVAQNHPNGWNILSGPVLMPASLPPDNASL